MSRLNRGFTLIELLVTLAILGVIAGVAIPSYNGYVRNSYNTECQNEITAISLAQTEYFLENSAYFPEPAGTTNGVPAIETASNQLYTSGYTVAGNAGATAANILAANCTYSVTSTTAPSYTITATGQNNLDGSEVFTKTN